MEGKEARVEGIPYDKYGGPGFYNDPALVWRGYADWVANKRKPSKREVEAIDPDWDFDLNMAAAIVAYAQHQNDDPLGGSLNGG